MPFNSALDVASDLHDVDAWVFSRVSQGDFSAIEELYQRYSRPAFGLAMRMLQNAEAAEDAIQEAFLRFWKNPASYNPEKGRFSTWLFSVVHNICIDQLRRDRSRGRSPSYQSSYEEEALTIADARINIEEEVWLQMESVAICEALTQLPALQRDLIELAFFTGLTHSQIVLTTGLSLGTVKGQIRQGLMKLQKLIAAGNDGVPQIENTPNKPGFSINIGILSPTF